MVADVVSLVGGLLLLVGAATLLVRGAAALALRLGLTPLVVGLTVVAFGTSAPELVVSVRAALDGAGGIAIGNVVGSNIANVGLVLGVAVLIRPILADPSLFHRDLPTLLGVTVLASAFLLDGAVGRVEGALLIGGLVVYLIWSVRAAHAEQAVVDLPVQAPEGPAWRDAALVVAGLAGLVLGADWFVGGAVGLAEAAGVSAAVIGLTVVAIGTSLPELATTVVAALRGESEIAVGNVVGSNLFNLLGILGGAALVRPLVSPGLERIDVVVLVASALALGGMLWTGRRLVRAEAVLLLGGYAAYMGSLALNHG